jgi:hypothetical protein
LQVSISPVHDDGRRIVRPYESRNDVPRGGNHVPHSGNRALRSSNLVLPGGNRLLRSDNRVPRHGIHATRHGNRVPGMEPCPESWYPPARLFTSGNPPTEAPDRIR